MIRIVVPLAFACLVGAAIGVSVSGCRPEPASNANGSTVVGAPAQPTPEESFQRIVDTFRLAVDTNAAGAQTGFLYRDDGGHSSLSIRNEVTDKLIPPGKEGEPYRGTITVASQYSYSLRIPAADAGDGKSAGNDQRNSGAQRRGFADVSQDDSGVDILDEDLMAAAKKSENLSPAQADEMVARRSDEDVRTYELAYEDNRWVLKTTLDPKTEQSIQYAFEHALKVQ